MSGPTVTVRVDVSPAVDMLRGLADRTRGRNAMDGPKQRAAEAGAAMISGVPSDSGELAGSIKAGGRNGPGLIVSDLDYAVPVFGGTVHRAATPPTIPVDAIAQVLADEVAQEVLRE